MNGDQHASWSNTSGTHTLSARQAVTALPPAKSQVVTAQIHDSRSDGVEVRLEGTRLIAQYDNGRSAVTLVIAGQRGLQHLLTDPGVGPDVESAADGAVRAARGGDAFVAAAVHQRGDHVVEHDPVGDPAAVTPPRVGRVELGTVGLDQGSELDPQGLGQGCW